MADAVDVLAAVLNDAQEIHTADQLQHFAVRCGHVLEAMHAFMDAQSVDESGMVSLREYARVAQLCELLLQWVLRPWLWPDARATLDGAHTASKSTKLDETLLRRFHGEDAANEVAAAMSDVTVMHTLQWMVRLLCLERLAGVLLPKFLPWILLAAFQASEGPAAAGTASTAAPERAHAVRTASECQEYLLQQAPSFVLAAALLQLTSQVRRRLGCPCAAT